MTRVFCSSCKRAGLSTEGKLYLCLFATSGHDLRALIRSGASDAMIATAIAGIWEARTDRYSQLRGSNALPVTDPDAPRVEMSYIVADMAEVTRPSGSRFPKLDITGVVLAGGRESRMGGVDKGLQPLNLEPLALHALRALKPQCGAMLTSANRSLEICAQLGMPFQAKVIVDVFPDIPGPLAGISAALRAAQTEFVLFVPCDASFVDPHLAERLFEGLSASRRQQWPMPPASATCIRFRVAAHLAGGRSRHVYPRRRA